MADPIKKEKKAKVEKKETRVSPKLNKVITEIGKLSVIELADLVKALEEKFGVSAGAMTMATPAPSMAQGASPAGGEAQTQGPVEFNVILASGGANKIAVIKVVRELKPDLGLKEAKDLVEAAPKELLAGVKKEEAEKAKKKLEEAGAQVELK